MKVLLLFNPISGDGRAERAARELETVLTAAQHQVTRQPTLLDPVEDWLDALLPGHERVVILGGDGAMRMAAPALHHHDKPVFHYPLGTENLFSREFGMLAEPSCVLGALQQDSIRRVDIGIANGVTFLLMASIGFDAEVVHDLASHRSSSISRLAYLPPICRQAFRWKPPVLTVMLDDEKIVDGESGFLLIANSRQYGLRFDPAVRADMIDGTLDVVFFPASGMIELMRWVFRARTGGSHLGDPSLCYRNGTNLDIRAEEPFRFQLDGDAPVGEPGGGSSLVESLEISLVPGVLPVLLPAS